MRRGRVEQARTEAQPFRSIEKIQPARDMGFVAAPVGLLRTRCAGLCRAMVGAQIIDFGGPEFGEAGGDLRAIQDVDRWACSGPRNGQRAAADADHLVAPGAQQFREVIPVLSRATDDQRYLGNAPTSVVTALRRAEARLA